MLRKNKTMIISIVLAILWMLFSIFVYLDLGSELDSSNGAEAMGTAIGAFLVMPYMVVAFVGVVLHIVGAMLYKPGLTLAGLICECVSIILMITWGFGFILVIIFGFIGYARMRKDLKSMS